MPKISPNINGIISLNGSHHSHASILLKSIGMTYIIYKDALKLDGKEVYIDTKKLKLYLQG